MKTIMSATRPFLAATLATTILLLLSGLHLRGADEPTEPQFPYVIAHELGAFGFLAGDQITITGMRGDRKHLEPGGSYLVEGYYTLTSTTGADLELRCTTHGPTSPAQFQAGQRIKITKGTGKFRLYETNLADGWLHVSICPNDSGPHGGVYLGEKDREKTIMRNREWFREFAPKSSGIPHNPRGGGDSRPNLALLAYLGDPVPPPADMDWHYDGENLLKAFTALCRNAGLAIKRISVDDSEFPFLLYGTLDGAHSLPEKSLFEELKGYTYGGSVRESHGDETYFAVNMVPSSQYPADQQKACNRRLTLRLQMLADNARQTH